MDALRAGKPEKYGYTRSKILGLFSFLDVSKADAAILHAAMSYVDHHAAERIHIGEFGNAFCPQSSEMLHMLWNQYTWEKPKHTYKVAVVHIDENDADALEGLEEGELQEGKQKERHLKEMEEHEKRQQERHYPTYVQFLCFLLFFMTTTDKTLPRWLYWLWFYIHNKRPSKVGLLKMASEIWPKQHKYREKYNLAVRVGVKVVDAGFDAATFAIYNSKCAGAFTRPVLEMKNEIYKLLSGEGFWRRIGDSMSKALSDVGASMLRLEDRKLKGTPELHASKGDRKQTRKEIRRFLNRYFHFTTMKVNEEVLDAKPGFFLPLIRNVLSATATSFASYSKAAVGSGAVGMNKVDFVRNMQVTRKLAAWHARRKQEVDEGELALAATKVKEEDPGTNHVPLEWKYRKQVQWPRERLKKTADETRGDTLGLIARVKANVAPAIKILTVDSGEDAENENDEGSIRDDEEARAEGHQLAKEDSDDDSA